MISSYDYRIMAYKNRSCGKGQHANGNSSYYTHAQKSCSTSMHAIDTANIILGILS